MYARKYACCESVTVDLALRTAYYVQNCCKCTRIFYMIKILFINKIVDEVQIKCIAVYANKTRNNSAIYSKTAVAKVAGYNK